MPPPRRTPPSRRDCGFQAPDMEKSGGGKAEWESWGHRASRSLWCGVGTRTQRVRGKRLYKGLCPAHPGRQPDMSGLLTIPTNFPSVYRSAFWVSVSPRSRGHYKQSQAPSPLQSPCSAWPLRDNMNLGLREGDGMDIFICFWPKWTLHLMVIHLLNLVYNSSKVAIL